MQNRELREDGSFELREDGGLELREGEVDQDDGIVRRRASVTRSARARGVEFEFVVEFFPGSARGSGRGGGVVIEDFAAQHGHAPGADMGIELAIAAGGARGQTAYDRAVIDADLLAIASL